MMSAGVKQYVRYWGFLLAKLLVAVGIFALLLRLLNAVFTFAAYGPGVRLQHFRDENYLFYLVCLGVVYLVGTGLVYLSILDQRYRCRVCLRRLRMPIETGSWSKMLQFGRPKMQYICIYGHGKLNIPELHLTGIDVPEWTEHADYWAELCGVGDGEGRDQR